MAEINKEVLMFMVGTWVQELKTIERMDREIVQRMRSAAPSRLVLDAVKRYKKINEDAMKVIASMEKLDADKKKLLKNFEMWLK